MDHYEGRSWIGWHHHTTLVMLARAFEPERSEVKKTSGWTLPRTRREIQYLLFTWTGFCAYCGAKAKGPRGP